MLSRKEMTITEAAMDKLKVHFESVMGSHDYGNGRFVRKMQRRVVRSKKLDLRCKRCKMRKESIKIIPPFKLKRRKEKRYGRVIFRL